jgi:hypothetical protein
MSTDKDKTGGGMGDRPVLFGPANDPALADRIEKLTGASLGSAIARLQSFSDDVFGDEEDERVLFGPVGGADEPEDPDGDLDLAPAHQVDEADEAAADGLDRILDTLSDAPDPDRTGPGARPVRSLFDVEAELVQDEPVLEGPSSPIAEVLARSAGGGAAAEVDYLDPELQDPSASDPYAEEEAYDPLSDLDESDPYEEELGPQGGDETAEKDLDLFDPDPDFPDDPLDDPDLDPDFPDEATNEPDLPLDLLRTGRDASGHMPDPELPEPDLPETGLDLFEEAEADEASAGAESGRSYGLPEPTPYGDQDGMGGLYGFEDEPETVPVRDEAEPAPETTEDWQMPDEETITESDDAGPARTPRHDAVADQDGSALDGLIKDLRWGRQTAEPQPEAPVAVSDVIDPEPAAEEPEARRPSLLPAFLRRDSGRPRLGELNSAPVPLPPAEPEGPDAYAPDPEPAPVADPSWGTGVSTDAPDPDLDPPHDRFMDEGVADTEAAAEAEAEAEAQSSKTTGARKRLLAGAALAALLVAAGAGAWLMTSGPTAPVRVADAGGSALAPLPDMGAPATPGTADFVPAPETGPAEAEPSFLPTPVPEQIAEPAPEPALPPEDVPTGEPGVAEAGAGAEPAPAETPAPTVEGTALATGPDADPAPSVSPEVADLMSELNRGAVTPAAPGASSEEVAELRTRLADMEAIAAAAQDRSVELSGELTSLTDQITGLLQRDSDQAERLDRMERLIRGQSAIMAQFGQMEESLEQTQVVLLDVSARIGAVEGQNPADRDAVNRALADIEGRIQALTANMSILARMSIEGVDALRAPNASAGSVGVQTAPQPSAQPSGGSDTVFRTETGGFRISSDAAGRIPPGVKKDDFIEGYGYVLDVLPASDGQRLVVMENGSVLVPAAN